MRELNFEFDNLERRSNNDDSYDDPDSDRNPVVLWTNHRVMEWLRVVDLAEYAPNMRGSGVHGGLMVYEPRFTSELLATLLSIPPAKTLLRRHLTTHFNQIIGRDVVQRKRELENMLGFMPLTLTARLKVHFFSLLKAFLRICYINGENSTGTKENAVHSETQEK